MPRSPTSSEDEMAQSFSDYSLGSESDSSKEETIYDTIRATAEKPSTARTEESQGNMLVIRILIPDLQQTVSLRLLTIRCPRQGWAGAQCRRSPACPDHKPFLPQARVGWAPLAGGTGGAWQAPGHLSSVASVGHGVEGRPPHLRSGLKGGAGRAGTVT